MREGSVREDLHSDGDGGGDRHAGGVSHVPDLASATPEYARRFQGEVGEWFVEVQTAAVKELLSDLPSGSRVLDVGGGHGQLASPLAASGHRVVVAGSAPRAARLLPSCPPAGRIEFVATSLASLPFASGSFDAVVCVRILAHIRGWQAFLAELCRVASGPVVVDYPSRRSFNVVARMLFWLKDAVEEQSTRRFRLLGITELDDAFRAAGYHVRRTRRQFFWPMALHRSHGSVRLACGLEGLTRRLGLRSRLGSPVVARADPRR